MLIFLFFLFNFISLFFLFLFLDKGIYLPCFYYHEKLIIVWLCRMCLFFSKVNLKFWENLSYLFYCYLEKKIKKLKESYGLILKIKKLKESYYFILKIKIKINNNFIKI